ncbi:MAG: N-formylglutamate amidohydrolase [Pseudomonadota bacterium]
MTETAFQLSLPEMRTTSVVFASPHSGRSYSWGFLRRSALDERTIRSSEDAFVDMLFDAAPACGAPLLAACAPRAFVDLNRSADELDPALIEGVSKPAHNPRVSSGLGVIPRVVANGRAIYRGKISMREAHGRLRDHWRPYHDQLHALLNSALTQFGEAILIDCHSMPHEALDAVVHPHGIRPEIVLGDRFGAAARGDIMDRIEAAFVDAGLAVVRNAPFAGAYTTQHYGRPSRGQHVIQVEIDRSLYMNEKTIRPSAHFPEFKEVIDRVVADIAAVGRSELPLAAE